MYNIKWNKSYKLLIKYINQVLSELFIKSTSLNEIANNLNMIS